MPQKIRPELLNKPFFLVMADCTISIIECNISILYVMFSFVILFPFINQMNSYRDAVQHATPQRLYTFSVVLFSEMTGASAEEISAESARRNYEKYCLL